MSLGVLSAAVLMRNTLTIHQVPTQNDPGLPRYCPHNGQHRPRRSSSFDFDWNTVLWASYQLDGSIYWNHLAGSIHSNRGCRSEAAGSQVTTNFWHDLPCTKAVKTACLYHIISQNIQVLFRALALRAIDLERPKSERGVCDYKSNENFIPS